MSLNAKFGGQVRTSFHGKPIDSVYGMTRVAPNLVWYGDVSREPMSVLEAIRLLNGTVPNGLTGVLRMMLMSQIQAAAKQGNRAAAEFVDLCALNISTATRH